MNRLECCEIVRQLSHLYSYIKKRYLHYYHIKTLSADGITFNVDIIMNQGCWSTRRLPFLFKLQVWRVIVYLSAQRKHTSGFQVALTASEVSWDYRHTEIWSFSMLSTWQLCMVSKALMKGAGWSGQWTGNLYQVTACAIFLPISPTSQIQCTQLYSTLRLLVFCFSFRPHVHSCW